VCLQLTIERAVAKTNLLPFENLRANGEWKDSGLPEKLHDFNILPFTLSLSKGRWLVWATACEDVTPPPYFEVDKP